MKTLVAASLLLSLPLLAHDSWLDLEHYSIKPGQPVSIYLCSGHYYPASSFAVKDKLVHATYLRSPSGGTIPFEMMREAKSWQGRAVVKERGAHLAVAVLKRPQLAEPEYWLRAIIISGAENDPQAYVTGQGLEIIPLKLVSGLVPDSTLPLRILNQGQPIKADLSVSVDGEQNFFLKTDKVGEAQLPVERSGKYLITFSHDGRGCSLTFEIP